MGWKIWQQGGKKLLIEPFHMLAATFLSLLPISFILLARLSTAHFLFSLAPSSPQTHPNPTPFHALVSHIGVAALLHSLTSQITLTSESPEPIFRPHLYAAWIFLCALLVCIGLGIEGIIACRFDISDFGHERSVLSRFIFFLGLHEMMLYWSRTVVKPVVDDTVFGFAKEERWVERVAMAASFGTLWSWRLRDEVESLLVMVEVER